MTPAEACADVLSLLTAANLDQVALLPHDPTQGLAPRKGTVTVTFDGMTPTEWLIGVRLYLGVAEDPAGAEKRTQALLPALDNALSDTYPRGSWQRGYHAELVATVCETVLNVGREDF